MWTSSLFPSLGPGWPPGGDTSGCIEPGRGRVGERGGPFPAFPSSGNRVDCCRRTFGCYRRVSNGNHGTANGVEKCRANSQLFQGHPVLPVLPMDRLAGMWYNGSVGLCLAPEGGVIDAVVTILEGKIKSGYKDC